MGAFAQIESSLLRQRGHLFGWVPVCLALGIGAYFMLRFEPDKAHYIGVALAGLLFWGIGRISNPAYAPFFYALTIAALGFNIAGFRAHQYDHPKLSWRYYGPVEGRIIAMDKSASDAVRLTLDRVVLRDTPPDRTPYKVRISLHGKAAGLDVLPGGRIMTTAHISPPQGPVEPGGFDFQRHAWFQGLGGVGYTRVPVLYSAAPNPSENLIFRIRMAGSARVQAVLKGDLGGFATAMTTGDRSAISQDTLEDLRISNLAHLLAISGLHMGILAGFTFASFRIGFAAIPSWGLRLPAKKLSAILALVVATGYLMLSGGNIATQRAYIMVAVALVAITLDRRALSLRGVAMAAILVLCIWPQALMGPGFQMSFAATTALVAVFAGLRDRRMYRLPKWVNGVLSVVISSAVAGFATAPIGAAHFNAFSRYGLIANLSSVPLMGVMVMPAAVVAACLAPFGLEAWGLWVMGLGLQWILSVAAWVSSLEGARGFVAGPPSYVLPMMALGCLFIILWQGRVRSLGLIPVIGSFLLWGQAERPQVLIADSGTLISIMTDHGRAVSKPKGAGFVAENWLENDGDGSDQESAAAKWPERAMIGGRPLVHLSGKRALAGFDTSLCAKNPIVVTSVAATNMPKGCDIYDPKRLSQTGSLAISTQGTKVQTTTARDVSGQRLWNQ
jgi:competence protein ComEC